MEKKYSERLEIFSNKLKEKISKSKRVILFQHKRPDLDSIGSNIGFLNYIFHFNPNCEAFIVSTDEPSKNLFDLVKASFSEHFIVTDPSKFDFKNDDVLVFIDFAEISRATKFPEFELPNYLNVFVIDHHLVEPKYVNSYIEPENQSASSIVYELLDLEGISLEKINYEFIIMGILGDSGFLRYRDNKFNQTLGIISKFITKYGSVGYYELIEGLEQNKPQEEYSLQKIFLNNLVYKEKFAYTFISNQQREEAGVSENFAEITKGSVLIRNIEKTKFVFSLTQDLKFPERYSVSFRTCSGSDFVVRDIAQKLGGGGHAYAAGAVVSATNTESAINLVVSAINELNGI